MLNCHMAYFKTNMMLSGGYEVVNKKFINEINKVLIFDTLDFLLKEREALILNHNSIKSCLKMIEDEELVGNLKKNKS